MSHLRVMKYRTGINAGACTQRHIETNLSFTLLYLFYSSRKNLTYNNLSLHLLGSKHNKKIQFINKINLFMKLFTLSQRYMYMASFFEGIYMYKKKQKHHNAIPVWHLNLVTSYLQCKLTFPRKVMVTVLLFWTVRLYILPTVYSWSVAICQCLR